MNLLVYKFRVISKNSVAAKKITIGLQQMERDSNYTYFRTTINDKWDHSEEI